MIYRNILETVGSTPLVELTNFEQEFNLKAKLIAKVERFNPAGSVKDRIAKFMIEEVEKETGVELDPKNVTFKVTKSEEYLEIEYTIEAKLLFIDKYLAVPVSIYLE